VTASCGASSMYGSSLLLNPTVCMKVDQDRSSHADAGLEQCIRSVCRHTVKRA
jgi:hypothetical protein